MKALSIRQPWAFSITHGGKDIENRDWSTRYRGPFLIHAGKACTSAEVEAWRLFIDFRDLHGSWLEGVHASDLGRGGIVGIAEIVDCVRQHSSPWFCGEYGFVIRKARPLPFMPLRGELGFFSVPSEILEKVAA